MTSFFKISIDFHALFSKSHRHELYFKYPVVTHRWYFEEIKKFIRCNPTI